MRRDVLHAGWLLIRLKGRSSAALGDRSSVGRASGCGPEGRGFEPRRSPRKRESVAAPDISEALWELEERRELLNRDPGVPDQGAKRALRKAFVERDADGHAPGALEKYVRAFLPHPAVPQPLECPYGLGSRAARQLRHAGA